MIKELTFIKNMVERVCDRKGLVLTPEFEKFLFDFLKTRFKCSDAEFVEEISRIYRIRINELEIAVEDAVFRYKKQNSSERIKHGF